MCVCACINTRWSTKTIYLSIYPGTTEENLIEIFKVLVKFVLMFFFLSSFSGIIRYIVYQNIKKNDDLRIRKKGNENKIDRFPMISDHKYKNKYGFKPLIQY